MRKQIFLCNVTLIKKNGVSPPLHSEHFFAIRHLKKLETASISMHKQNKSNI